MTLIIFSLKKEGKSVIRDYMDEPVDIVPSGDRASHTRTNAE